jgi:hypothetical protein
MKFKEEAEKILELAKKATPGPWQVNETIVHGVTYGINGVVSSSENPVATNHNHGVKSWSSFVATPAHGHGTNYDQDAGKNMQFIASANPASITRLLERLLKLEDAIPLLAKLAEYGPKQGDKSQNSCWLCDMGWAGYSSRGYGFHDNECIAKDAQLLVAELGRDTKEKE